MNTQNLTGMTDFTSMINIKTSKAPEPTKKGLFSKVLGLIGLEQVEEKHYSFSDFTADGTLKN